MRKVFMLAAVAAVVAGFMSVSVASADPATIIRSTGTTWFDGNGTPVFVPDSNIQIVTTTSPNGNVNVSAHGTLPDGSVLPTKAQQYTDESTGFFCGFGGATSFKGTTTPSGQFSFTCKSP